LGLDSPAMAWKFLRRLVEPHLAKTKVVTSIDVSAAGVNRDDPKAVAEAQRIEEDLRRQLEGAHDADEARARIARYEREHGMKEISSSTDRFVIVPDAATLKREGPEGIRRIMEELERDLEGAEDPAERRFRAESFARERGWTIREQ
jgi:hypothetical protein